MRAWRMVWVVLVILATLAVASTVAAQAEDEPGGLVERSWTTVFEVFVEGGTRFAGEARSDFDGACSEPVDLMWVFRVEGLDSIFGRVAGTWTTCVQIDWGVDADGAPTMTGMRYTDWGGPLSLPDGSTIDAVSTYAWVGFDADGGYPTSTFSIASSGGGTGRFAGAELFGTVYCRREDPDAIEAGLEPQLCVVQGMAHYDPLAGRGE